MSRRTRRSRTRGAALLAAAALIVVPGEAIALAAAPGDTEAAAATATRVIEDIALWSGRGVTFSPPDGFLSDVPATHRDVQLLEALYVESDATGTGTMTPSSQAALIEADLELAARLARADEQARALGALLMTEAKAAADYAIVNMRDDTGRYVPRSADGSFGESTVAGDARMLAALTRLQLALDDADPTWPYDDVPFRTWFEAAADEAAVVVFGLEPTELTETAAVIQALAIYGAATGAGAGSDVAVRIEELAGLLPLAPDPPVATAHVAAAHRAAAAWHEPSTAAAEAHLGDLAAAVDTATGAVLATDQLTLDDVGVLVATLNAGDEGASIAAPALEALIGQVVGSGLLTATEIELAPTSPRSTGRLPAAAVGDAGARWSPTDEPAALDSALRLLTELLRAAGPPDPGPSDAGGAADDATGAPRVIDVIATDFAFSVTDLVVAAGEEVVIRLDNQGLVPHNIDAPDLGLFVEAPGGEVAEITYTAPAQEGGAGFICNLPGHLDAGMKGTVTITSAPPPESPTTTTTSTTTTTIAVAPPVTETPVAPDGGPRVIEIIATEFAFAPSTITIAGGEEVVIRLTNQGLVPHNIDAPDLGLFVAVAGGETKEVAFVAPTPIGSRSFVCSIPGHADAGMTGSLQVTLAAPTRDPAPESGGDGPFTLAAVIFTSAVVIASAGLAFGMVRFTRVAESQR